MDSHRSRTVYSSSSCAWRGRVALWTELIVSKKKVRTQAACLSIKRWAWSCVPELFPRRLAPFKPAEVALFYPGANSPFLLLNQKQPTNRSTDRIIGQQFHGCCPVFISERALGRDEKEYVVGCWRYFLSVASLFRPAARRTVLPLVATGDLTWGLAAWPPASGQPCLLSRKRPTVVFLFPDAKGSSCKISLSQSMWQMDVGRRVVKRSSSNGSAYLMLGFVLRRRGPLGCSALRGVLWLWRLRKRISTFRSLPRIAE